jgi:hypothetical protein
MLNVLVQIANKMGLKKKIGPPLWSSCRSSWLRIQRSGFDSRRYQIFCEVVDLERGPLSLINTTEELIWRNSSGSCLESWKYTRGDPLRWPRDTLYPQTMALTSPTSDGRSVGIVRLQIRATEFFKIIDLHAMFKPYQCSEIPLIKQGQG